MRRFSVTATLSFSFAMIAAITFSLAGSYLDKALSAQLNEHYDTELALKLTHLEHFVVKRKSVADLQAHADLFLGQFVGNSFYEMEMDDAQGKLLLHFGSSRQFFDKSPLATEATILQRTPIVVWQSYRGIAETAQLLDGTPVRIIIARNIEDGDLIVDRYRDTIILTGILGACAATVFGYLLARHAMAPLRRMASDISDVTTSRLDLRLNAKSAPRELGELALSLNDMLTRLDEGYKRLSEVTGDLAHDLRTPIANLRGQTEVTLSRVRDAEEYQALLVSNLEEYQRLTRMIENMLFLARADNAQVALHPETLNLPQQMEQIAAYFENLAEEADLRLLIQVEGQIFADKILFQRAISNLISNALRYTPRGRNITVQSEVAKNGTRLSVSNPGAGIPEANMDRLFERFYRGDGARSNSADSTGLGLAIVRTIMDLHRGTAWAESVTDDHGENITKFFLLFPPAP